MGAGRGWWLGWLGGMLAGMFVGLMMLTPAGAHISTFAHLKAKHFYTKKAADSRFIEVGEKASSAGYADTAKSAAMADAATTANTANVALSPVAFAHVLADASVDETQSRGVGDANVTYLPVGIYCFSGLTFPFKTVQVSMEHATAGASTAASSSVAIHSGTCAGAQADVHTFNGAPMRDPEPFYIWFFN
jgi:hypothetical protein